MLRCLLLLTKPGCVWTADRDSRLTQRRSFDVLGSLASGMEPDAKPETVSLLNVLVQNLDYRIESENVLFTRAWKVEESTFEFLRQFGMRGLRLYELNAKANPRLVSCNSFVVVCWCCGQRGESEYTIQRRVVFHGGGGCHPQRQDTASGLQRALHNGQPSAGEHNDCLARDHDAFQQYGRARAELVQAAAVLGTVPDFAAA